MSQNGSFFDVKVSGRADLNRRLHGHVILSELVYIVELVVSNDYHRLGSLRESTHFIVPPSGKTEEFNFKACQPSGYCREC